MMINKNTYDYGNYILISIREMFSYSWYLGRTIKIIEINKLQFWFLEDSCWSTIDPSNSEPWLSLVIHSWTISQVTVKCVITIMEILIFIFLMLFILAISPYFCSATNWIARPNIFLHHELFWHVSIRN